MSVRKVTDAAFWPSSLQILPYEADSNLEPAMVGSKNAANRGLRSRVFEPSSTAEKNWRWACTLPEEKMARVLPAFFQDSKVGITSLKSGVLRSPLS